jgi:hypothetical protein
MATACHSLGLFLHFKRWGKDELEAGEAEGLNDHQIKVV